MVLAGIIFLIAGGIDVVQGMLSREGDFYIPVKEISSVQVLHENQ